MISLENLDIRTVTLGISLLGCSTPNGKELCKNIDDKIVKSAQHFVAETEKLEEKYGIPIVNKRITVTPISCILAPAIKNDREIGQKIAYTMDDVAEKIGVDLIGGYSSLVQRGVTLADTVLIKSIPEALSSTSRVCSSITVAGTKSGLNPL